MLLIYFKSLKRDQISYFSVALGSTLDLMVTFQGGHIQTVYLYVCVYIHISILVLGKKLSDLQNITLHFRPIYGTSSLSTDVILTVGLYHSIQETGKFGKLQNTNYYYNYNSRDF